MLQVAIVDDEKESADSLRTCVERYCRDNDLDAAVEVFPDGLEFLDSYDCSKSIVFMDIDMPYMNGLDAAKRLRSRDEKVCLIFVTRFAQYAIRGYAVQAMDYLLKPIAYGQFELAMDRAMKQVRSESGRSVLLTTQEGKKRVEICDIAWLEVYNHDLIFHISSRTETTRGSLQAAEEEFAPYGFARASSSYLINLGHVKKIDGNDVLVDDVRLPMSRGRKKEFMAKLADYLGG